MNRPGRQDGAFKDAHGEANAVRVSDLLAAERIRVPLAGRDKAELLRELVDLVVASRGLESDREAIYAAVLERENVLSTGIGDGVALPHAKFAAVNELVMAAGVSREPVEFGALDGQSVRLFFLLLGPDSAAATHVRALARVSRLMRENLLRQRLLSAEDAERFLTTLAGAERAS